MIMKKKQGIALLVALAALALSAMLGFLRSEPQPETKSSGSSGSQTDPTPCDPHSCPVQSCRKGSVLRKKPGNCCPECVKVEPASADCEGFECDECPQGPRVRECCPACVPAHDKQCDDGRRKYAEIRPDFEERLVTCTADTDCMLASFVDDCRPTCSMPLNKMRLGEVVSGLQEEARKLCGSCTPAKFECPNLDTKSVACLGGECVLDPEG